MSSTSAENRELNPYASPQLPAEEDQDDSSPAGHWVLGWMIVYPANLVVPYLFAEVVIRGEAYAGMAFGMLTGFVFGLSLCLANPRFASAVVSGGIVVGFLQFFPVLHFLAGMVANWVVRAIGQGAPAADGEILMTTTVGGGFVATLVTGGLLLLASFVIGLLIQTALAGKVFRTKQAYE